MWMRNPITRVRRRLHQGFSAHKFFAISMTRFRRRLRWRKSADKIFCIGLNKTGTTSLAVAFRDLGYVVGKQRPAELLLPHYIEGDFEPIIRYCRTAEVFQDIPFSLPNTFRHLDLAYPGSKFILTIRDSPEQWFESLTRFHAKLIGGGRIPTVEDLKNADHIQKGWSWQLNRHLYQTPENDPYNRAALIAHYERHNRDVMHYFACRDSLLAINVAQPGAYQALCRFIGAKPLYPEFPWENKTSDAPVRQKLIVTPGSEMSSEAK
jgi:Sulfotransferase domain